MVVCERFKQFMLGALNESEQSHKRHRSSIRIYQLRCLEYFSHWVVTLLPAFGIGLRGKIRSTYFSVPVAVKRLLISAEKCQPPEQKYLYCRNATSDPPKRNLIASLCVLF